MHLFSPIPSYRCIEPGCPSPGASPVLALCVLPCTNRQCCFPTGSGGRMRQCRWTLGTAPGRGCSVHTIWGPCLSCQKRHILPFLLSLRTALGNPCSPTSSGQPLCARSAPGLPDLRGRRLAAHLCLPPISRGLPRGHTLTVILCILTEPDPEPHTGRLNSSAPRRSDIDICSDAPHKSGF